MSIISQNSNNVYYAYTRGRFWRWDESARVWKESHLLAQKFGKAKTAEKRLTPEAFLTSDEFIPMDDYELPQSMLTALREAKPCKNAPIEPVEEESSSDVPASCICSTCTCGGCKEECFGNCHSCGHPVQECNSYQTEGEKHLTPTLSEDVAEPCGNVPSSPSFDFSALGDLSEQAVETDQQFDLHYNTAQDEYLISCIYVSKMHALTAKAGRYGGGTWTKWYESKGLSEGSARTMTQNGDAFKSATIADLKLLPSISRKDLNLIARSGCAEQLTAAAGDSQRVQELLAQLKAEKSRADTAESHLEAAHADINGLTEQNAKLQQSYHDADEGRIAARLQCQKAEGERDRAEERAKNAEDALKKQPITAVIDEEEIDRRATEKAWGLADARNAELAKDNANLKKQVAALRSRINDDAQADFEQANYCASLMRAAWDNSKASYSRLVGEDLESTFQTICGTLNSIMEEASLLCRQPPDYDGGDRDE
jgi:predicted  nucleic acid-binding Zn-ribbon protein